MVGPGSRQPGRRQLVTAGVAASILACLPATAQASLRLKIGVIGDTSSTYAEVAGEGSVLATRMAVEDFGGKVLANGRMVHDMYLMQVKSPAASKSDWDVFKLLETIPGDRAFRSLETSGCTPVAP